MNQHEEFYVGYLPHAPRRLSKWIRNLCIVLLGSAALVAVGLVWGLRKLPFSVFEFGQPQNFEGIIQARPYPTLLLRNGKALTQHVLVAEGKHGAEVAEFDGRTVRLKATRIYRDGLTMLEVVTDSLQVVNDAAITDLPAQDLGTFTLVGEIVDSKCYVGVMNPGETKVHRECAVRCISGGIPPMLVARDVAGNTIALQLVSSSGAPVNQAVLDLVAEPVQITGQVVRRGEQLMLKADPNTYLRVP
ncbi:MAG TPA: hypothetical protein VFZ34_25785 [Blastocatellia bacterium]|nr:hypothetical protein [Blastocatellia bacterium]